MIYNSFFEKQQTPVPGPLDADFHILQLEFGGESALQPRELLKISQELDVDPALLERGFYTDIPPQLGTTIEESEHTIEVAVRRSFDFMKLPVILGGSSEILPAVFRGVEGQAAGAVASDVSDIAESDASVVVVIDADTLPGEHSFTPRSPESVAAVVLTGSSRNETRALRFLLNYLQKGIA